MKKIKKHKIKAATIVQLMNILHLNRGGISAAFHNELRQYSGKCTVIAHRAATADMQLSMN